MLLLATIKYYCTILYSMVVYYCIIGITEFSAQKVSLKKPASHFLYNSLAALIRHIAKPKQLFVKNFPHLTEFSN